MIGRLRVRDPQSPWGLARQGDQETLRAIDRVVDLPVSRETLAVRRGWDVDRVSAEELLCGANNVGGTLTAYRPEEFLRSANI
jgi:hypothetical protein